MIFTADSFLKGQILLIDKPLNWTSFQAVKKVKYSILNQFFNIKSLKIGHAGTLDPLASGLLIMCTGRFTKSISSIQIQPKEYIGVLTLGATTPSYDLETEIDQRYFTDHITEELIQSTRVKFIGKILQRPPVFSALKKKGKRLYEYARKGKKIIIEPRPVEVSRFDITKIDMPEISFQVECSKGTYIRSLVHDFGKALNTGGHLSQLKRTRIGDYTIENAVTPSEFEEKLKSSFLLNSSQ